MDAAGEGGLGHDMVDTDSSVVFLSDGATKDEGPEESDATRLGDSSVADGACTLSEVFLPPCNSLVPSGSFAKAVCSSGEPPQVVGGALTDGTYILESATWYAGCPLADELQGTLRICGGVWEEGENSIVPDAHESIQENFMASIEDTSVVLNPICTTGSSTAGFRDGFTASGGRLTRVTTSNGSALVRVYNLQ